MLRKSHFLNKSACTFEPDQQSRRSDFQFCPWGIPILVRWSKTIQFREKIVQLPLPCNPGSPLFPATTVQRVLSFTHGATPESQAFMWYDLVTQKLAPFTYPQFMRNLSTLVSLGLPNKFMRVTRFAGVGPPMPFRQVFPLNSLKYQVTGSQMPCFST